MAMRCHCTLAGRMSKMLIDQADGICGGGAAALRGADAVGGATDDRAKIQMDRASIRTPAPAGPPWRATALIHPPLQKAIGKERRMTGIQPTCGAPWRGRA